MDLFHKRSILHELTDFSYCCSYLFMSSFSFKDLLGIVNLTSYVQPLSYKEIIYYTGKATSLSPLSTMFTYGFTTRK